MSLVSASPSSDWTGDRLRNSHPEWARFSDFLLRRGVALLGTSEYDNVRRAPSHPALAPFAPGEAEAFVHSWLPSPPRDEDYKSIVRFFY
ncbi:hypothetical protein FB451DRAFT_1411203 [Mycena latifolia]|nr:hypothetical protein FB451DRAFT_1411203 [Mycena latifolia]